MKLMTALVFTCRTGKSTDMWWEREHGNIIFSNWESRGSSANRPSLKIERGSPRSPQPYMGSKSAPSTEMDECREAGNVHCSGWSRSSFHGCRANLKRRQDEMKRQQ